MNRPADFKARAAPTPETKPIAWLGSLQFNTLQELATWASARGQLRAVMRQLTRRVPP